MENAQLLTWIVFVPVIGAVATLLSPGKQAAKMIAIGTTVVTFFLSLLLFGSFAWWEQGSDAIFGAGYGALHHEVRVPWIEIGDFRIDYHLGVDGLSFPLVILTTLISMLAAFASWNMDTAWKVKKGVKSDGH